jgi:hypothetical protein
MPIATPIATPIAWRAELDFYSGLILRILEEDRIYSHRRATERESLPWA